MTDSRVVRIFISSTFRDFGEERDLLVRQVFPALRAKLRDRFVELVDIDLRWGITAEQAERGEVLPICLAEIERSRPYFIAMLGERYGWIPPAETFAPGLLERQGWLRRHRGGKSVTELEVLHGVLNNRRMKGRAFFYFRAPAYARTRGRAYLPASAADRVRQADLKRRIKASGYPVAACRDPRALVKRIERDLWTLLDAEFPASSVPDAFERDAMRHEAYAAARRRLYVGGERYLAALGRALESGAQLTLVEGVSGGGKSTLLVNFVDAYRKRHPKRHVHEHYLGASDDAGDPHALVRRLCEFVRRRTGSNEEIPADPRQLMDRLPFWLATASAWARRRKTRVVFVLDGLDGLTDQHDLRWWPSFLPQGVQFVVSCLPGTVLDALKARAGEGADQPSRWKVITIKPLGRAHRKQLLTSHLARFNKTLPAGLTARVMAHPLSGNPLFIRTLAEELRLFGVHEELADRLAHYLESETIDVLFEKVIERVEGDFGRRAVKATLTAIWASRAGLTEKELLGIAGLTAATWAPIRHALDEALVEADGKITFAHAYFFSATQRRFGLKGAKAITLHRSLLRHWRTSTAIGAREKCDWHGMQIRLWTSLTRTLVSIEARQQELAQHPFFRWDGHVLALWQRQSALRNMLQREPRVHPEEPVVSRSGGAHDDYTTYWRFPCCGHETASEYGPPSRFRLDGCAYVPSDGQSLQFRTINGSLIPYWCRNDLRTVLEASLPPRALLEAWYSRGRLLELRRLESVAGALAHEKGWDTTQALRDYFVALAVLESRFGVSRAAAAYSARAESLNAAMVVAQG